jgi:predicted AlkP superfamily pyrophosphatase or phosphodiesterase
LRFLVATFFRLIWGVYLLLTSIYCLLAFLPYTFFALIKAPPYEWLRWFAHYHGMLYLATLIPVAIVLLRRRTDFKAVAALSILGAVGGYLTARPFLPHLHNDSAAYVWSLAALVPLVLVAVLDIRSYLPQNQRAAADGSPFVYSNAVLIGGIAALSYAISAARQSGVETQVLSADWGGLEVTAWSVITHILVAIIVFSILNLIQIVSWRMRQLQVVSLGLVGVAIFVPLWIALLRFVDSALTFSGFAAYFYTACLALAVTLFGISLSLPFFSKSSSQIAIRKRKLLSLGIAAAACIVAVAFPTLIGGGDWNGVLQRTLTLAFWMVLGACVLAIRPARKKYSIVTIVAVLLLAGFAYKSLQATEIFWAKPLGATDDEVARTLDNYAEHDASFQLAHHILGNGRSEPCSDLCRIMREYTNIRDAQAKADVDLVDPLVPSQGRRPNIFLLVIDSMRPDYLGAYNPKVDFTPNLDAFARESIAVHNVYTQYAGTTLSEPAIWSGTQLLHAHYIQPFSRVNNLEKLARADGYKMIVSYDTVLSQILSADDDLTKVDTDKPLWNRFEVCSTLRQTSAVLGSNPDKAQPVLFYAQPMNVHQFAHNDLPSIKDDRWHPRPGFNNRIAHEVSQVDTCLGNFFSFLKTRNLYDSSIIVVTSDHGDATGEFGRYSHSLSIYPEVMRVPLIVHLPSDLRRGLIYDESHLSTLTDITPSLYYLLGHRPIRQNPLFGHPIFVESKEELAEYRRDELFLASDERAVYGWLTENGRFLYATYDSPAQSYLFDLSRDPNAEHNILTPSLKQRYDEEIISQLHAIAEFYGYKPGVGWLMAAR